LDEHGIPKYKGKKRGRKPKFRKRKLNPNRRKRQHTAYTIFVQETYPGVKAANPTLPSKDVISIVAKRWGNELTTEEKQEWKARAVATHGVDNANTVEEEETTTAAAAAAAAVEEDEEEEDEDDDEEEDDEEDVEEHQHEEVEEVAAAAAAAQEIIKDEDAAPPARRSKRGKK
jgi:hypothetical protein